MTTRERTTTTNVVEFEDVKAIRNSDSEKALLVCGIVDDKDTWVPHKMIHEDSEVLEPGDEGTLIVSKWWAETAGVTP